jgi:hypothetical protein
VPQGRIGSLVLILALFGSGLPEADEVLGPLLHEDGRQPRMCHLACFCRLHSLVAFVKRRVPPAAVYLLDLLLRCCAGNFLALRALMALAFESGEFIKMAEAGARAKFIAVTTTTVLMTIAAQYDEGSEEERIFTVCVIVNGLAVRECTPRAPPTTVADEPGPATTASEEVCA